MNFEQTYAAYAKTVYNLALHYTQRQEDAEEITQDVFLKVYDRSKQFRGDASFKTYITRLTINQSLDFIRYKNRKKRGGGAKIRQLEDVQHQRALHTIEHPGYKLEQKEATQRIFAAINQLPAKQRTTIILLKIEGNTQAETADIMNTSVKAIESLFQRAKRNLQSLLDATEG